MLKNILFDNVIFDLQMSGGISVYWKEIISRALSESKMDSFFLESATSAGSNIFRKEVSIPLDKIIVNNSIFPLIVSRYLPVSTVNSFNIFHSSYYRYNNNKNINNITTVHDFTYEKFNKGIVKHIHSQQKKTALFNSEAIICVSENTKNDLLYYYPKLEESKISVIHNGVGDSFFPIDNNVNFFDSSFPFEMDGFILFVGDRKSHFKNFDLVVKASKKLEIPLVLVGGGSLSKNELEFLDGSLKANRYKQYLGIDNVCLNQLYNAALCLLYPSNYEGFGIPIIEAQKAKCPVVCAAVSSLPEVSNDHVFYFENFTDSSIVEAVKRVKNTSISDVLNNGYINSKRFSWQSCYERTFEVYNKFM